MKHDLYYCRVEHKEFRPKRRAFIEKVAELVKAAVDEVGIVTVRGAYYRAVSCGLVESGDEGYQKMQAAIRDGRAAGLIAWNAIEDRGRQPMLPLYHESPTAAVEALANDFRLDPNAGQPYRIEVWLEQAALTGAVWPVCSELGVPLVTCSGFTSHDSIFKGSERLRHYRKNLRQQPVVLMLSDFDPSGLWMPKYIESLLTRLSGDHVPVQRIGLTKAQAVEHQLLGRDLKAKDSRAAAFREEHGDEAYELDGLPAAALQQLVRTNIEPLIDWGMRARVEAQTEECKRVMRALLEMGKEDEIL